MTDEEPTPLADLATVEKANWDASWAANNQQEVGEAYQRLVSVLERSAALREIAQAIADGDVYHDATGSMLIVADADVLLAKARALLDPKVQA